MAYETETSIVIRLNLPKQKMEKVAKQVVRLIERRTASGLDMHGNKFVGYSEAYINSINFKAADKSPGQVNLRLIGEMMTELDVISASNGKVTIGFEDPEQRAKAHGHQVGKEGGSNLPKREFIGVSVDELASAIRRSGVVSTEAEVEALLKGATIL
jgi:hypothetical protein